MFQANTALHYALTYKNFPVVSIMLDSGECAVNMVNQVRVLNIYIFSFPLANSRVAIATAGSFTDFSENGFKNIL